MAMPTMAVLLLRLLPVAAALTCNESVYPYVECQASCNCTGGPSCAGGSTTQQQQPPLQLPRAGTRCLNCSGTVCTMSVLNDTAPPETEPLGAVPAPGKRVMLTAAGWAHTKAFHTLLLPAEWTTAEKSWPLLVEFPGNGCGPGGPAELNDCGSIWTTQGWGVGLGRQYLWLTLPFLTRDLGNDTQNSMYWWGCSRGGIPGGLQSDACDSNDTFTTTTTLAYAKAAIAQTLAQFHGRASRVLVLGHSRGAIATQAIAGADDEIASLWAGAAAFSHYDGAETWPYSSHAGGAAGAVQRAQRLSRLPKFLTGECDLESGVAFDWLRDEAKVDTGKVHALGSGFREHTGFWILRPSAARSQLRAWVAAILLAPVPPPALAPEVLSRWRYHVAGGRQPPLKPAIWHNGTAADNWEMELL
jgi:hypothetical protein